MPTTQELLEHTPEWTQSPWHCKGFPTISATGGGLIAKVLERYMNKKERRANARLIAAAPDLYEALLELTDLMQGVIDGDYEPDAATLQIAHAALVKAQQGNDQ